jgi:predicted dehydrogenase
VSVRVGVIGTGWWATRAHLPALAAHPDAVVVAAASPGEGNRRKAAERFGIPRTYPSAAAMLDAEELDAAVVCTPHDTHAPLARLCLERGLHVLIEKPMTIDPADAYGLVDLARSVRREILLSYPWHYNSQALELRAALAEGAVGPPELASVLFASIVRELYAGRPEPYRDVLGYPLNAPGANTYSDPSAAGGGQGQTQVTHAAALLFWITGLRPVQVAAVTAHFELAVDLADGVAIRFEGGAIGSLASTGSVLPGQGEILEYRIFGPEGHLLWDVNEGQASIHGRDGRVHRLPALAPDERYPEGAPARNLVGVALGREPNGSPAELGALTVSFVDAVYRSARTGRASDLQLGGPRSTGARP